MGEFPSSRCPPARSTSAQRRCHIAPKYRSRHSAPAFGLPLGVGASDRCDTAELPLLLRPRLSTWGRLARLAGTARWVYIGSPWPNQRGEGLAMRYFDAKYTILNTTEGRSHRLPKTQIGPGAGISVRAIRHNRNKMITRDICDMVCVDRFRIHFPHRSPGVCYLR